jgi:hypothetical protein
MTVHRYVGVGVAGRFIGWHGPNGGRAGQWLTTGIAWTAHEAGGMIEDGSAKTDMMVDALGGYAATVPAWTGAPAESAASRWS